MADHYGDHFFPGWPGPDSGAGEEPPSGAPSLGVVEAFGEIPGIRLSPKLGVVQAFGEIPGISMPAVASFGDVTNTELISMTPQRRVVNY